MISPHTPSGTRVICVDVSELSPHNKGCLTEGAAYTLLRIEKWQRARSAVLEEVRGCTCADCATPSTGFSLTRFRRADLPECLTSILRGTPIDSELERTS